eukprot:218497-Hanusia_phi.AAC.1
MDDDDDCEAGRSRQGKTMLRGRPGQQQALQCGRRNSQTQPAQQDHGTVLGWTSDNGETPAMHAGIIP